MCAEHLEPLENTPVIVTLNSAQKTASSSSVKTILAGLPWWGGPGGLGPPSSKKLFVGGPKGALKIGQVLVNIFRKKFARGA